jgi:hypothetical protein
MYRTAYHFQPLKNWMNGMSLVSSLTFAKPPSLLWLLFVANHSLSDLVRFSCSAVQPDWSS